MSLNEQYTGILEWIKTRPVEESGQILKAKADIVAAFDPKKAIQVGSKLPPFTLSDATGKQVSSTDLLAKGPVLINFYRGEWCPFCSLELRAFQQLLPKIQAKGVTFLAISPELPDISLSTKEKHELKFTVLSDLGNKYAHELGIVYQQPDELRPVFKQIGNDLKARNGDDSFTVPIPAMILVDKDGVVRNVHLDADYFKRLEPEVAVGWIDAL